MERNSTNKKKKEFREKRRIMRKTNKRFSYKSNVSLNWFNFIRSKGKRVETNTKQISVKNIRNSSTSAAENGPIVTKILALDCEMVSDLNNRNMLGRVSIVNYKLECLYDKYVKPTLPVGDYRTRYSGIRKKDLQNGVDFYVVKEEVKKLLKDKILVGHALSNDFSVLHYIHNRQLIRDTAKYPKFCQITGQKTPSLKTLVEQLLGENIQQREHCSVEDAKAAMKLYIKFRHEWEHSLLKKKSEIIFNNNTN